MARTDLRHLAPAARTKISSEPSANNAFIGASLDFDDLIAKLHAARAAHFGVDPDGQRTWAEACTVDEMNRQLASALAFITGTTDEEPAPGAPRESIEGEPSRRVAKLAQRYTRG